MDLNLAGRVAVVTAASKGIGLACARTLAAEGASVVAAARNVDSLEGLYRVTAVALDLTAADAPAELVRRAVDEHGRLDILVNNMGALKVRLEGFLGTSDEEFEWAWRMNFLVAVRAIRAAIPAMLERGEGSIVNVASVNAFYEPDAGVLDYGAAKAALVNLAKSLAEEFGPRGIRVNTVSPGPVSTDLWLGDQGVAATIGAANGVDREAARDQIVAGMGGFATGRLSSPDEVAAVVTFLASRRIANVTGSQFVIDGGLIKTT